MSWTPAESQQIGRMESKLNRLVDDLPPVRQRVVALETFANRAKGVLGFLTVISTLLVVLLTTGCATAKTRCVYKGGELRYSMSRSTVVGKGDVDVTVEACSGLLFETHDTGISDNGKAAIDAAVDAALKATALSTGVGAGGAILDRVKPDASE